MEEGTTSNEQQSVETFYPLEGTSLDKTLTSNEVSPSVEGLNNQIEAMISSSPANAASESVGSQHPLTSVLPSLQQQIVNASVLSDGYPIQLSNQSQLVNNGIMTSVGNLLQLSLPLQSNQQVVTMATSPNILQLPTSLLTGGQEIDSTNVTIGQAGGNVLQLATNPSASLTTESSAATSSASVSSATNSVALPSTAAVTTASQPQPVKRNITTTGSNPLQVSVKTNSSVNQALLNDIVNSQAVQNLLRDNPGQPITIVRMPQTVQQVPKSTFPLTPLGNLSYKTFRGLKRNGAPIGATRGRRPRKVRAAESREEKSKFVEVQKSLQFKTRSGRVSKPPMYRVKETLPTPVTVPTDQVQGDTVPVRSSPEGITSAERSPLDETGHTTVNSLRGLPSSRRGQRGYRGHSRGRRRSRGHIGNHGTRESLAKIKQLLPGVSDEDFISLVCPKLCELLSPWDFMLMRAFRRKKTEPDRAAVPRIKTILDEFQELLSNMRKLSRQCLVTERVTPRGPQSELEVPVALHEALGMRGRFYVREMPKELLTSRVVSLIDLPQSEDSSNKTSVSTVSPDVRNIEEGIIGVESLFPENSPSSDSSPIKISNMTNSQLEPSSEVSSTIVNVEEIETTDISQTNNVTLNDVVQDPAGHDVTNVEENLIQEAHLPENAVLTDNVIVHDEGSITEGGAEAPQQSNLLPSTEVLNDSMPTLHEGETLPETQTLHGDSSMSNSQTRQDLISLPSTQTMHVGGSGLPGNQTLDGAVPMADTATHDRALIASETLNNGNTLTGGRSLQHTEGIQVSTLPAQETAEAFEESMEADCAIIEEMDHGPGLPPATSPMVPVGSTIMQMADGNFLVQKPDGTAMQIHAPQGMTIETIQALLTVGTEVSEQPVQAENDLSDPSCVMAQEGAG